MKHTLLLSVLSIGLLSGCSTAFKAGQTPDDVYYSPGREVASAREDQKEKVEQEEYQEYISSQDDRYLHMKVANRNRWSSIDNFDYWYDSRYDFSTYNDYNSLNNYSMWNPGWNLGIGYGRRGGFGNYGYSNYGYGGYNGYGGYGWNNPLYTLVHYTNPKFSGGGSNSGSNISSYRNKTYSNTNFSYRDPKTGGFVSGGNNSSFGNLLKRVFTGTSSSNSNSSSYDRPARTFSTTPNSSTPAPAPSSSAGGTSGGFKSTGSSTSTGRGGKG
ncbi:MAG: hypothetical protein JWQ78_2260 [Sediminibacterium sp.]|nr:hypothetical protein [Sediminibacterium sp.]